MPLDPYGPSAGLDPAVPVAGLDPYAPDPNAPGPVKRGFGAGVAGVKSNLWGAAALAAHGAGAILPPAAAPIAVGAEQTALENAKAQSEVAAAQSMSPKDVAEDPSRAFEYFKFLLGNSVPSLATMAVGGAIGGVGGAMLGRGAAVTRAGALMGAVAPDVALEAGGIYPEALDSKVENPALRAAGGGALAASLDFLPLLAAEHYLKPIGRAAGLGAMAKGAAKGAPVGAALEGTQEGLQSVVERMAAGKSLTGEEANQDYLGSVLGGMVPGLFFGAGIGAHRQSNAPVQDSSLSTNSEQPPIVNTPPAETLQNVDTSGQVTTNGNEAPPPTDLPALHAAVSQQIADTEPLLAQAQTAHDSLVARRKELDVESKLEPGQRRTKSEITVEKKALAEQIKVAKAKIEEVGGQLNSARTQAATLAAQLDPAAAAMAAQGTAISPIPAASTANVSETVQPAGGAVSPVVQPTIEQVTTKAVEGARVAAGESPTVVGTKSVTAQDTRLTELHDHIATYIAGKKIPEAKKVEHAKHIKSAIAAITHEVASMVPAHREAIVRQEVNKRIGMRLNAEVKSDIVDHIMKTQYSKGAIGDLGHLPPISQAERGEWANLEQGELEGKLSQSQLEKLYWFRARDSEERKPKAGTRREQMLAGHAEPVQGLPPTNIIQKGNLSQYSKGAISRAEQKGSDVVIHLTRSERDHFGIVFTSEADRAELMGEVPSARFDGERLTVAESDMGKLADYADSVATAARGEGYRAPSSFQKATFPPRPDVAQSHAALIQDEFDTLPEPAKVAAVQEFNRVMMERGTELRKGLEQLYGNRPGIVIKTFVATPSSPIGSYTRVSRDKAVITLALNAKEVLSIKDHEGFHAVEDLLMTSAEKRILANALRSGKPVFEKLMEKVRAYDIKNKTNLADEVAGVPAEARAYAFEFWRRGEIQLSPTNESALNRILTKIKDFLTRVANLVRGMGFKTMEDIFTALDRGQFAERTASQEVTGELVMQASKGGIENSATMQALDLLDQYQWKNISDALDWLTDDRSHGDEYVAAAAREVFNEHGAGEYGKSKGVKNFVVEVIARAREAELEENDDSTQFSRAAVEMATREQTGELERNQEFATTTRMMDSAQLHKTDHLMRAGMGPIMDNLSGTGNSISRWWQENIATPNYISRLSQGFKNVYKTLNNYIRYRETLIEKMLREQMPEWYTAHFSDQDAAFNVLLKRTMEGYTADSQELKDLLATLTPEQKKLFDGATRMIAGFLRAELAVDTEDYKRMLTTPGAYDKWLSERTAQVQEMIDTGYVPLRRYGDFTVRVYKSITDKEGKPQQLEVALEMFRTERQANIAARIYEAEFKRQGAAYTVEQGIKHKSARDTTISVQQFLDTARRNGVAITETERERLVLALTASDAQVRNRMMRREGYPGFSKDGMRVLNEFGVNMSGKIAYAKFGVAIDAAAEGRAVTSDVVNGEPAIEVDGPKMNDDGSWAERADAYEARNLWTVDGPKSGFYRNQADALSDYVLVPDHTGAWSRNLRGAAMMYFIGGSISGAMVNTMSVPMLLVPELSIHTGYGNALATSLGVWKQTWQHQAILRDITRLRNLEHDPKNALPGIDEVPGLREAIIAASDKLHDTELHQIMSISQGQFFSQSRTVQKAITTWMVPFRISEQTNRITSFIAGYKIGKENGLTGPALFNFARDMVDSTQNNYSQANRPGAARNPVWAMAFMFKSFPLFMTEAIALMYKANPKSAVFMLLGLVGMTGVQGLPFAETIEDLIDTIAQRIFNSPFNTRRAMRNVIKSASEAIVGYDMSDLVLRGVINDLVGMSVSSRIGAGDFVPGTRLGTADADQGKILAEIAGAPFAMVHDIGANIGKLAGAIASGDAARAIEAFRAGGPIALRNAVKGAEQLRDGYASDSKGRKIVDVSTPAALWQMAGVSSADVAKMYELESINIQTKAFYQQFSQDLESQLVKAMKDGDSAKVQEINELRNSWNQQYPTMPILPNAGAVRRQLMLSGLPMDRRSVMQWSRATRGANVFTEMAGE